MKVRLFFIALSGFLCLLCVSVNAQPLESDKEASSSLNENIEISDIVEEADNINTLRSLLIWKDGRLLTESYFDGRSPNRAYNIKSASKSIMTLLIGIALEKGIIDSLDTTLGDYFPEYFAENPDPKKSGITLRQLLSMQAGLETTSFYNYGAWVISDDWVEFQLDQPFVAEPGGQMVYSTGISHLLSVILTKETGRNTMSFANEYLFDPLNITPGGWDKDPEGYYMGGNNLALKPIDLLKIGRMLLDGGVWEGQRIISGEWIRDSFNTYTRSNYNPYDYGYMWWNKEIGDTKVFFAWGYGGQYLFMIPELNAITVITSAVGLTDASRSYKEPIFTLLENKILPHLKKAN